MNLGEYVDKLRRELAVAAEAGGDDARVLAERLMAPLESSVRLTLLEVLSAAADEITRDLAPGSVQVRLRGREPAFVVSAPPAESAETEAGVTAAIQREIEDELSGQFGAKDGAMARINFRPPEGLKVRIEEAAGRDGLSVNAWLVRAATAALDPGERRDVRASGNRLTGWVG